MDLIDNDGHGFPLRENEKVLWSEKPAPFHYAMSHLEDLIWIAAILAFLIAKFSPTPEGWLWWAVAGYTLIGTLALLSVTFLTAKRKRYVLTDQRLLLLSDAKQIFSIDLKRVHKLDKRKRLLEVAYRNPNRARRGESVRGISNPADLAAKLEEAIEQLTGEKIEKRWNTQFKERTGADFPLKLD